MSEESDYSFSDGDIDDEKHKRLVENVLNLNKIQNIKKSSRTEPSAQISEFDLVKSLTGNKGYVHINELAKALKGRKKHLESSNKIKSTSVKNKTLPKPLEKPQIERIRRTLNYEKSRLQLDKWEALVTANRAASTLSFPLDSVEKVSIEEKNAEVYPSTWRLKSDLQKELEQLNPKVEEYRIDTEEKEKFPLTLEELTERRREAAKLRAHQSFKEAKARQQNKIKSKKYHRILRREKIKKKLKEFEELQKTNPEEALLKLEDIEKARAEERFSLRHKGTGQWARNKQVRAKYDKESRQVLAQQLAISRDLTKKLKPTDSDSEDEAKNELRPKQVDEGNPWVNGIKPDKDVTDFVSGYRKYWNEQNLEQGAETMQNEVADHISTVDKNKTKVINAKSESKKLKGIKDTKLKHTIKVKSPQEKNNTRTISRAENTSSTSEWKTSKAGDTDDVEDVFDHLEEKMKRQMKRKLKKVNSKSASIKKKRTLDVDKDVNKKYKADLKLPSKSKRHVIDEEMIEQAKKIDGNDQISEENISDLTNFKNILNSSENNLNKNKQSTNINPDKFIQIKQIHLKTATPDITTTDDNEDHLDQRDIILEAFEDDDIAADFQKEKEGEIEKDKEKDIDLNLPGWGSWGGTNINPSKRKRKRFIIKMPPKMPRRDDNKGTLIINEKAGAKMRSLMVSEVPFPFKTVKDFEASIRAPIGNTFVPETAFKKLIEPAITTKMGAIIEPINRRILMGIKRRFRCFCFYIICK